MKNEEMTRKVQRREWHFRCSLGVKFLPGAVEPETMFRKIYHFAQRQLKLKVPLPAIIFLDCRDLRLRQGFEGDQPGAAICVICI